jgi:SAUR family protein
MSKVGPTRRRSLTWVPPAPLHLLNLHSIGAAELHSHCVTTESVQIHETRNFVSEFVAKRIAEMEQSGVKKSNKITEIVRMQQMLKKWRKLSVAAKDTSSSATAGSSNAAATGESKAKKFLKRTLSFTESPAPSGSPATPPKGHLAVSVGPEMQRFVIPMEYLKHRAFAALLQEAEEEFGFQQAGVLRIPCEVPAFVTILKAVEKNKKDAAFHYCGVEYAADEVDRGTPNNRLCR